MHQIDIIIPLPAYVAKYIRFKVGSETIPLSNQCEFSLQIIPHLTRKRCKVPHPSGMESLRFTCSPKMMRSLGGSFISNDHLRRRVIPSLRAMFLDYQIDQVLKYMAEGNSREEAIIQFRLDLGIEKEHLTFNASVKQIERHPRSVEVYDAKNMYHSNLMILLFYTEADHAKGISREESVRKYYSELPQYTKGIPESSVLNTLRNLRRQLKRHGCQSLQTI